MSSTSVQTAASAQLNAQLAFLKATVVIASSVLGTLAVAWDLHGRVERYFNRDVMKHCHVEQQSATLSRRRPCFDDVIGCDNIKSFLRQHLDALFSTQPQLASRGFIFAGSAGQGKTYMAAALAGEMQKYNDARQHNVQASLKKQKKKKNHQRPEQVQFVTLRLEDIWNDAEVSRTIEYAIDRYAPCILFVDEFHRVPTAVQEYILTHLDGIDEKYVDTQVEHVDGISYGNQQSQPLKKPWMLLACTTKDNSLSAALTRSGRLDNKVTFHPPNEHERMLSVCRNVATLSMTDARVIAQQTAGHSHADIAAICRAAKRRAHSREPKGPLLVTLADLNDSVHQFLLRMTSIEGHRTKDDIERIAVHEIGHCLTAYVALGIGCPIKVYCEGDDQLGGYNLMNITGQSSEPSDSSPLSLPPLSSSSSSTSRRSTGLFTRANLVNQIAVYMGGTVAEQVISGARTTGCLDDLSKVESCLGAMEDAGLLLTGNEVTISSTMTNEQRREAQVHIMTTIQAQLTDLFMSHQNTFRALSSLLLAKRVLTTTDIREALTNFQINEASIQFA